MKPFDVCGQEINNGATEADEGTELGGEIRDIALYGGHPHRASVS